MKTLTVGNGGREHAMMLAFEQGDESVEQLGIRANPGMMRLDSFTENLDIDTGDIGAITRAAQEHKVDLVAVGPEVPLVNGLADRLRRADIAVLGFGKSAAQLAGQKLSQSDLPSNMIF